MKVSFSEIEYAFLFVSSDMMYTNNAYLCLTTGKMYYTSEWGDFDEFEKLPEDFEESDDFIQIPHRNELNLGRSLAIEFTSEYLPDELDRVYGYFSRAGAYARFKDLLDIKDVLDDWYKYENERTRAELKDWCERKNIELIY
ncbi:MAG: hypothetical protein JXA25_20555 [Anaerolineales bacterium]|nr:hypothetical protein [Anaerolineales bacterium]